MQQVGEDDGKEPWDFYSSPTPTSSLPSPKYEERLKFGRIMEDVLAAEKEEELPGLLTKHVEFLLSVDVTRLTNDLIRYSRVCLPPDPAHVYSVFSKLPMMLERKLQDGYKMKYPAIVRKHGNS